MKRAARNLQLAKALLKLKECSQVIFKPLPKTGESLNQSLVRLRNTIIRYGQGWMHRGEMHRPRNPERLPWTPAIYEFLEKLFPASGADLI